MSRLRRHPSPATVISLIALFVALGGTSYAAVTISGKNVKNGSLTGADVKNSSLTGKDVKNNALTGADVKNLKGGDVTNGALTGSDLKNDSVGGKQINESTLGKVPSAANADKAADSDRLGGKAPSAYALASQDTLARSGAPTNCDPGTATFQDCSSTTLATTRSARLVLNAQSPYHEDTAPAAGQCRVTVDGTVVVTTSLMGTNDAGSAGGTYQYGSGVTAVSNAVPAGTHTVTLQCNQTTGDIHYIGTTVSAIAVSGQ